MNLPDGHCYIEGNTLLINVARAGALRICVLQDENAPELDIGPFPDKDIKGNQELVDRLCATFPCLLRNALFCPGPQNDNDGYVEVHGANLFKRFSEDPASAREEWWWIAKDDAEVLPIELGTITDLAVTLKLGAGRGMLRWPYGLPPAVMFWPSAILSPRM